MKTVVNKTRLPIKVPLPRGKALHLGPGKEGQIRDEASEHAAVKKLVDSGKIEIFDGGARPSDAATATAAPHEATHGQGKATMRQRTGDR